MALIATNALPRPELFRPRTVRLSIKAVGLVRVQKPGEFGPATEFIPFAKKDIVTAEEQGQPLTIDLTEVLTVKQRMEGRAGVMQGVAAAIVQMWYMGPIRVEIAGRSYIGSFSDHSYNKPLVDNDIERLLLFRDYINKAFMQGSALGSRMRVDLQYGDRDITSETDLGRGANQKLVGVIESIDVNENHTVPYMKDYVIRFVGFLAPAVDVNTGADNKKKDNVFIKGVKLVFGARKMFKARSWA